MKIFVTGATGFIGSNLCQRLAADHHAVIALYRDEEKLKPISRVVTQSVRGDLSSTEVLRKALNGCESCFHLAALAKPWVKSREDFHRINVVGTRNVLQACVDAKVHRVVFTSTASVFGPSDNPIDESHPFCDQLDSEYERTKRQCEFIIDEFRAGGLDIVTVYPSRVYGPGVLSQSNALTTIIKQFLDGKWNLIPDDGTAIGNYVFVDDVVEGHRLALLKSLPCEKYILGGENLSMNAIFDRLQAQLPYHKRIWHAPKSVLNCFARLELWKAKLSGLSPLITPPFVEKYIKNWSLTSDKARRQLGYQPKTFDQGLRETIEWIAIW